ncbi:MAG: type II toxin-antitoxin system HicB family antitoxin [Cyanobacteria bacterium P01_G01_bin.67]
MHGLKYRVVIQWSNEDNCFLVSLPDFKDEQLWVTHGETYQEALENAVEVMDMLVKLYQEKGKTLPKAETLYNSVASIF